jgi:3-oxoacyl-[acyl-carrier protein] reductase
MDLGNAGKRALVCGGSRGLGYGCASALVREGDVTIVARDTAKLSGVQATLSALRGGAVHTVQADVTSADGRGDARRVSGAGHPRQQRRRSAGG